MVPIEPPPDVRRDDPSGPPPAWIGRAKRIGIILTAPLWLVGFVIAGSCVFLAVGLCWAINPLVLLFTEVLFPLGRWAWNGDRR